MVAYPDSSFSAAAANLKGKVVLITGAASGFGKAAALEFGRNGAQLVLGDVDAAGVAATADAIVAAGGEAVHAPCDVRSWESQRALFALGVERFGRLDVVMPNAGVRESGFFSRVDDLAPPQLDTFEINIVGVLYTTRLALYYLTRHEGPGRAIVFVGSMASLIGLPGGCLYGSAKHAILGLMRALYAEFHGRIRTGVVCPWFADTGILTEAGRAMLNSTALPLAPVSRVVGTLALAAGGKDDASDGCIWTIPDGGEVFRVPREAATLTEGVYKVLNARLRTGRQWSDSSDVTTVGDAEDKENLTKTDRSESPVSMQSPVSSFEEAVAVRC